MAPIEIEQNHYGNLKIEFNEKDVICIWNEQKNDPQVIFIERENINEFIKALSKVSNG